MGVGCSEEEILPLANSRFYKVDKLPIQYFDLPIGANPRLKGIWDLMMENFDRKLSSWKKRYLSMGGRVTLIKVIMSNLPVYYICTLKMAALVKERLERIIRDFL